MSYSPFTWCCSARRSSCSCLVGRDSDSLTTNCLLHSFDGMYVVCFEIYIVKYPYISVQWSWEIIITRFYSAFKYLKPILFFCCQKIEWSNCLCRFVSADYKALGWLFFFPSQRFQNKEHDASVQEYPGKSVDAVAAPHWNHRWGFVLFCNFMVVLYACLVLLYVILHN